MNGRLPQTTMAWVHDSELTTRRVSSYASSLCSRPHHALGVSPGRPAVEGAVEDPEGPSDALALYPGRRPATTTAIVSRLCRRSCCSQRCSRTRRLRSVLERKDQAESCRQARVDQAPSPREPPPDRKGRSCRGGLTATPGHPCMRPVMLSAAHRS